MKLCPEAECIPILKAVHFEGDEVVALDGYRMAIRKLNAKLEIAKFEQFP